MAKINDILIGNDWKTIASNNNTTIRYCRIGQRYILHIHFQNAAITTIGETVFTVNLATYPQLTPSFDMVQMGSCDLGSNTGRAPVTYAYCTDGKVLCFPALANQMSGNVNARIYADLFYII